ncbi:uracil-DNA glycosylase [Pseudomonas sp. B21-009]|uniref:uracil-DNA glycosylase n=1 Tax=Pseudomonas sp. B21-009 TaxID=2895470 RepID=UPI00215F4BA6|nr:uracil-DNA glycosylase [Pseudomonas sp. B21-009]UVM66797.1 uracil-DNA glycosylase [Pseudomonas sp. B21-009]
MNPIAFVEAMSALKLENVFNPYADQCPVHDRADAVVSRRENLLQYLKAAAEIGIDTIWMGRDLGYRGGRRTGLALTDEYHLPEMNQRYPGASFTQATLGPAVAERTATEIWSVLRAIQLPPLLWNVFPFHPHEPGNPFTNRKFTSGELKRVNELNNMLIKGLKVRRVVAIGQDAFAYASKFDVDVVAIRHPSYGGIRDFRNGMSALYDIPVEALTPKRQVSLF